MTMKTSITLSLLLCCGLFARAQDLIVLRSGDEIEAKVEEVATDVIKYKKFDNLTGPSYSIEKYKVFMIRYENGSKDVFKETEPEGNPRRGQGSLAQRSFNINPLGLLQFGPIFQYEIKTSENSVVAPYFRYGYLGVVTHALYTEFDDNSELSPATFGVGIGMKGFMEPVGNTWYYGGFAEFNIGKVQYDIGEPDETEFKDNAVAFVSNLGYRWRNRDNKYVNVGLFAGVNIDLKAESYYVSDRSLEGTYEETLFFAMIELAFGW